jgi:hypothetical protein
VLKKLFDKLLGRSVTTEAPALPGKNLEDLGHEMNLPELQDYYPVTEETTIQALIRSGVTESLRIKPYNISGKGFTLSIWSEYHSINPLLSLTFKEVAEGRFEPHLYHACKDKSGEIVGPEPHTLPGIRALAEATINYAKGRETETAVTSRLETTQRIITTFKNREP